jgi:succinate-semialdehyde dehydrogenase/glutarate-semialdehyde dehydrogenase
VISYQAPLQNLTGFAPLVQIVSSRPGTREGVVMRPTIDIRNPRTGQIDFAISPPDRASLETTANRMRVAQIGWERLGVSGRAQAMLDLCDAVERHRGAIIGKLSEDTGRYEMSVAELEGLKGITGMRCATAEAALAAATGQSQSDPSLRFQQQYVPLPLVGIISPWNYPLILCMIDAITALLAGSAVLVKPSEVTPRFIQPFRTAIAEVEALRDILVLVEGGAETGQDVIDLTDTVVFTGSVPTGKLVQQRAASQFKTAFLELGGNDAAVVLASADADEAAEIIVRGAVENSGQLCCAIERVYAEAAIAGPLSDAIVARMNALKLNTADVKSGEMGPIIYQRQAEILQDQLDDAVAKGARVLAGGKIVQSDGGLWCQPTVLADVDHTMKVMQDETFGPIIPIMRFDTVEQAITLANDTIFGLSATVIGDEAEAIRLGERLNAGGVWINDFDTMGGVGDKAEKTAFGVSGLGGTRYGPGGFLRFLRKKALVIRAPKSAA